MNSAQVIDELTNICIRQAEIIRTQAFELEQLGAQAREERSISDRLQELVGCAGKESGGTPGRRLS